MCVCVCVCVTRLLFLLFSNFTLSRVWTTLLLLLTVCERRDRICHGIATAEALISKYIKGAHTRAPLQFLVSMRWTFTATNSQCSKRWQLALFSAMALKTRSLANNGTIFSSISIYNALRAFIRQLSSFTAPTLWFIDLTVATCHIQYNFLTL